MTDRLAIHPRNTTVVDSEFGEHTCIGLGPINLWHLINGAKSALYNAVIVFVNMLRLPKTVVVVVIIIIIIILSPPAQSHKQEN